MSQGAPNEESTKAPNEEPQKAPRLDCPKKKIFKKCKQEKCAWWIDHYLPNECAIRAQGNALIAIEMEIRNRPVTMQAPMKAEGPS